MTSKLYKKKMFTILESVFGSNTGTALEANFNDLESQALVWQSESDLQKISQLQKVHQT